MTENITYPHTRVVINKEVTLETKFSNSVANRPTPTETMIRTDINGNSEHYFKNSELKSPVLLSSHKSRGTER